MTNYADYAYYTGTYGGAVIDAASFDLHARKATQIIKQYTFGNIVETSLPDEIKMCCCELAEAFLKHDLEKVKGNITSEKVGECSVSYMDKEKAEINFKSECYEIIYRWLAMTGLLYRGC